MRVAVFSDVHGNTLAFDAVLEDIARVGGVDEYWFVGDAAAQGFDPVGAIRSISSLPSLKAVRGNSDRFLVDFPDEEIATAMQLATSDPVRAEEAIHRIRGLAWTTGAITVTECHAWLSTLPLEKRITLPDGTQVLLVHASPGTDDGRGITSLQADAELAGVLDGANADLVIVGHTHQPLDRLVSSGRAWNLGSVSNPVTSDRRAMWTLLEADESGHELTRQYAVYDGAEVVRRLEVVRHPAKSLIRRMWDRG